MWVLIIVLIIPAGVAMTSVPDYPTEQTCKLAAGELLKNNAGLFGWRTACIPGPRER